MPHAVIVEGRRDRLLVAILALVAAGVLAILMGHDANWDLKNYHLYDAFALSHWRYGVDLVPAEMHSLFNPLIDLPYYVVLRQAGLQAATLFQSVYYAVLVYLAYLCGLHVFSAADAAGDRLPFRLLAGVSALLGATGAAALPQVATTFNEIQLAALIVAGMACVLGTLDMPVLKLGRMAAAGGLLGAAAGLKLTAAIYAPAFLVALLVGTGWRGGRGLLAGFWFCVAWVVSLAVVYGWWGLLLYRRFESPVFPLYNAIFRSPWYPPVSEVDTRFFPKSPAEWLAYPFNWATRLSGEISEPMMRDPRLAAFLLALAGLAFVGGRGMIASQRLRFLLTFGSTAYIVWLKVFSTLRYAIPLEIIAGLTVVLFLALAFRRSAFAASAIGFALLQAATVYPVWGRIPFEETRYRFEFPPIPDGALVLTGTAPVGYVLPFLPAKGLSFVNAGYMADTSRGYRLNDEVRARIAAHAGPILALGRGAPNAALLATLELTVDAATCRTVASSLEAEARDITICVLRKG